MADSTELRGKRSLRHRATGARFHGDAIIAAYTELLSDPLFDASVDAGVCHEEGQRSTLDTKVGEYTMKSDNCPFDFQNFDTLSGEDKATFAWMAVNDITRRLYNDNQPTDGILEMGGPSFQIAFKLDADDFAHKFPLYIKSKLSALFADSFSHRRPTSTP